MKYAALGDTSGPSAKQLNYFNGTMMLSESTDILDQGKTSLEGHLTAMRNIVDQRKQLLGGKID